jgi:hypothetical protein
LGKIKKVSSFGEHPDARRTNPSAGLTGLARAGDIESPNPAPRNLSAMRRRLCQAALVLFSGTALAGPLGLDMGQPLAALSKSMQLKKDRGFVYTTRATPRPHADFESYQLMVTPEHGLCKIGAIGKTIQTDASGETLRHKFDELEAALSRMYGRSDRIDQLDAGSVWQDDRDWMRSLRKEERSLTSFWLSSDSNKLPDRVVAVSLEAKAIDTHRGWIALNYEFANASSCLDVEKRQQGSSL